MSDKETTFTKENLYSIWNALEYTAATISPGCSIACKEMPDWVHIHKGRAHQSRVFLDRAIQIINQMQEELE